MTSDTSPRPISPLRARMIEDMTVRGFKEDTLRRLSYAGPGTAAKFSERAGIRNPSRKRPSCSWPNQQDVAEHAA